MPNKLTSLLILIGVVITSEYATAQGDLSNQNTPQTLPSESQLATIRAEWDKKRQDLIAQHNEILRKIDNEWQRQRDELNVEKNQARQAIQNDWANKQLQVNNQNLSTDDKRKKIAELNAEKDNFFAQQTQSYNERMKQVNALREQNRASQIAAQGEMLVKLAIDRESQVDGVSSPVVQPATTTGLGDNAEATVPTSPARSLPSGQRSTGRELTIVQTYVPKGPRPVAGKSVRVPLRVGVHNSGLEAEEFTLRLALDLEQFDGVTSPVYSVSAGETLDLTWSVTVDLRGKTLVQGQLLKGELSLLLADLEVSQASLNFNVDPGTIATVPGNRQPAPVHTISSDWNISLGEARIDNVLETNHVRESRRQIVGIDISLLIHNHGNKAWEAPITIEGRVSAEPNNGSGISYSRSIKQRVSLERPLEPGRFKAISLRFGGKNKKFQVRQVVGGPPQPPGSSFGKIPVFAYTDAFVIEPDSNIRFNAIATSVHDQDPGDDQVTLSALIDNNKNPQNQERHTSAAPGIKVTNTSSSSANPGSSQQGVLQNVEDAKREPKQPQKF